MVASDGSGSLTFPYSVQNELFVVVYHRNHVPVMSANPVTESGGIYHYDFTISDEQFYGGMGSCIEVVPGVWSLIGGDADADGSVNSTDKDTYWNSLVGLKGYLKTDFNLDGETDNKDKNNIWIPANGSTGLLP